MDLQGVNVLITGASRGLGRELAVCFAAAGATPVLVARDELGLAQVAAQTGGLPLAADLSDPAVVRTLWARAEAAAGPIAVLVNNAGIVEAGDFADCEHDAITRTLQVNVLAPVHLCRDAAASMQARSGGHLVNVSSLAAVAPLPGLATYSTSKAALSHFTRALAVELAGLPIGTTLVELGPVPTDMAEQVTQHHPASASFDRLFALRLLSATPAATAAAAVVHAVQSGRPHVRLPRRAAGFGVLAAAPSAAVRLALTGVPRRA